MKHPWRIGILVGISGFCSLIYQVVWDRVLRSNFGGDDVSSAIVAATFVLGLGLGAWLFGSWHPKALRRYACVELGIGVYSFFSYSLFSTLSLWIGKHFEVNIAQVETLRYPVVLACVLLLLPPCILMGGTLPLMFNSFISKSEERSVGWIYGVNTLGAGVGVMAAAYLLLNHLRLPWVLAVTASLNICMALFLLWVSRLPAFHGSTEQAAPRASLAWASFVPFRILAMLSFFSGFLTLAFETVLFRFATTVNKASPYNYPSVIFLILLSLALGSIAFSRGGLATQFQGIRKVGRLFLAGSLCLLVGSFLTWHLLAIFPTGRKTGVPLPLFLSCILTLLLPFFFGGIFPLLLRVASPTVADLPRKTGQLYLINSLGSFLGAMLTQFLGFRILGTTGILTLLVLIGFFLWLYCYLKAEEGAISSRVVLVLGSMALGLSFALLPNTFWNIFKFGRRAYDFAKAPVGAVESREGETGISYLLWENQGGSASVIVNSSYMAALPFSKRHLEQIAAFFLLPNRSRVLVLGLGGGNYVRELVQDPKVESVEVVDWSRELSQLLKSEKASKALENAMQSPKVTMRHADARLAVDLYHAGEFDVVIDNLAFSTWAGATNIKSVSYYAKIRRILKPGGVFLYGANFANARDANLSALARNFPYVLENSPFEVVLCSDRPMELKPQRNPEMVRKYASHLGIAPEQLAKQLEEGFVRVAASIQHHPPIVDDLLVYEYHHLQSKRLIQALYGIP